MTATAERAQKIGFKIPGLTGQTDMVQQLRDGLTAGEKLTKEQLKAVAAAEEFAQTSEANVRVLERQAEQLERGTRGLDLLSDSKSRDQAAQELAPKHMIELEAKQAKAAADLLPNLQQQAAPIQRNI